MTNPRTEIARIDREIDAVRRDVCSRVKVKPISALSWQRAWDKFPDLYLRHRALFAERGRLQLERDLQAEKRTPVARTKRCHACKGVGRIAA